MRYLPEKSQPYLFNEMFRAFKASLLLLALFWAARLAYVFFYAELIVYKKNMPHTLASLWMGLRFDLMPIASAFMIPLCVLSIGFVFEKEYYLRFVNHFLKYWYLAICTLFSAILFVDLGFYGVFEKHMDAFFLESFRKDSWVSVIAILKKKSFFFTVISLSLYCFVVYVMFKKIFKQKRIDLFYMVPLNSAKIIGLILTVMLTTFFLSRGQLTLSVHPLPIENSQVTDIKMINDLSLNGVVSLSHAFKHKKLVEESERSLAGKKN